ncbi:MAG: HAD family hydrolase [Synergistaceae bacterium]|nr:HAD family hydrolase [Synergistaceae bacterium]
MERAVFLDRDGTLIEYRSYPGDPGDVKLAPGAAEALRRLKGLNFRLVVVTNQSGVARGYFDESAVEKIHGRIRELLQPEGIAPDAFYYCPHGPAEEGYEGCCCRKPLPGMILQAAKDLGLDPGKSWMIGDSACDIRAGLSGGCRAILLRTGRGAESELELFSAFTVGQKEKSGTMFSVADDLRAAAGLIVQAETGFST